MSKNNYQLRADFENEEERAAYSRLLKSLDSKLTGAIRMGPQPLISHRNRRRVRRYQTC